MRACYLKGIIKGFSRSKTFYGGIDASVNFNGYTKTLALSMHMMREIFNDTGVKRFCELKGREVLYDGKTFKVLPD